MMLPDPLLQQMLGNKTMSARARRSLICMLCVLILLALAVICGIKAPASTVTPEMQVQAQEFNVSTPLTLGPEWIASCPTLRQAAHALTFASRGALRTEEIVFAANQRWKISAETPAPCELIYAIYTITPDIPPSAEMAIAVPGKPVTVEARLAIIDAEAQWQESGAVVWDQTTRRLLYVLLQVSDVELSYR